MKPIKFLIIALSFSMAIVSTATAQIEMQSGKYVQISIHDDNTTAELLSMPIKANDGLTSAEIGMMYFGTKADSDLSVILYLKGSRTQYSSEKAYGIKLFTENIPLSTNRMRGVSKIVNEKDFSRVHFYLKREELAWLATGESVKIEIYDSQTEKMLGSVSIEKAAFTDFKKFAQGILLIISMAK